VTAPGAVRSVGEMRRLILLGVLAGLAGCGNDERAAAPAPSSSATSLVITVDADGDGPKAPTQSRCAGDACPAVSAEAFKPVRPRQVCTDIFGGPQTATIEGTLRGRRVSARFSRQNGCEVTRWELAKPLLAL